MRSTRLVVAVAASLAAGLAFAGDARPESAYDLLKDIPHIVNLPRPVSAQGTGHAEDRGMGRPDDHRAANPVRTAVNNNLQNISDNNSQSRANSNSRSNSHSNSRSNSLSNSQSNSHSNSRSNSQSNSHSNVHNAGNNTGTSTSTSTATQSNANSATGNTSTNTTTVGGDSYVQQAQQRNPVASAMPPALAVGQDTCMGSTSVGAQGVGLGVSIGNSWTDDNCVMLKNSTMLWNMGKYDAAVALMCSNEKVRDALEMSGTECPQTRRKREEAANPKQVSYNADDPYIAARMKR